MASTAEELASQAELLQASIAFFKTGETRTVRPQGRKAAHNTADMRSTAIGLSRMNRGIHGGTKIDLDSSNAADARDCDFTTYEA